MTNPPQDRDESGEGPLEPSDPDRHATRPVPSFQRPPQPVPPYTPAPAPHQPYGLPHQPPAQPYGPPQPAPGPYGAPPQHGASPYGGPPYGGPQYGGPPYGSAQYGSAQYGIPQYGPVPAPPSGPATSRVGLIAAVTAGILVLIAGAVVLGLTLSSTVLDRTAVERDVAAQFEEREGVAVDLSCAEEMKVESGASYQCTGTTADGEDVTLEIAITDEDSAAYTWTEP